LKVERLYSGKKTSGFVINNEWFLKVYHDTSLRRALDNILKGSKPEREYFYSKLLLSEGIPTVEAVSYRSSYRLKLFPQDVGFVKFKFLKDLMTLDKLLNFKKFPFLIIKSLNVIAYFHSLNLLHGDLALSNLGFFNEKIIIFNLGSVRKAYHPYFAHKETFRFLHDLYKVSKGKIVFDYRELFDVYLKEIDLRNFLKRKLEREFLEYARERGMIENET